MTIFFVTIAFILGLVLTRGILALNIVLAVIYILFLVYRLSRKYLLVAIFLFGLGIGLSFVRVTAQPINNTYKGVVVEVKENYYVFESRFEKFYIYDAATEKECGDILTLQGKVSEVNFTTYESQFDFNNYLSNKGIYRKIDVKSEQINFQNPLRINKRKSEFLSNFDSETASLIDSFLFNRKDYGSNIMMTADSLNIMSLLSMNGVYLYFVASIIDNLFQYVFKKKTSKLLTTCFLLPYLIFSFTKFGILRVITMRILSHINEFKFDKKYNHLTLLSFQMLFFLTINYHLIYQESFYYGFAIAFMLIFIRLYSTNVNKKIQPLIMIMSIWLFMLPLSIRTNNEFHIFSLIFQAALLPIHEVYSLVALLSLYTFPFKNILCIFTKMLIVIYKDLQYIDLKIPCGELYQFIDYLFYITLFISFYFYEAKRKRELAIIWSSLTGIILFCLIPIRPMLRNAVYFVNVGQGDSIIIQNQSHAVMIDTGGSNSFDMASKTLIPFLKKKQIYKLDALITSHDDFDHSGAKDSLLKNYKVDKYISSRTSFPYTVGDITLTNINTLSTEESNDASLVLTMGFMDKKWLFTGDASTTVEKFLIDKNVNLDCDILKVGHHGSKTSTCEEFLKATTPSQAIISVGASNYYKHPSDEVIKRLEDHHIRIRRTDVEGTISFVEFTV